MSKPYMNLKEVCELREDQEFRKLQEKPGLVKRAVVWLLKKLPRDWVSSALRDTHDFYLIALFKNGKVVPRPDGMQYYEADGNISWHCTPTQCYTILYELSKKMKVEEMLLELQRREKKDAGLD